MRVYHFLSAENGLSDVSLRRIRISRFRDLNDPFELLAVKGDHREFQQALRSWGDEINRANGLLCFSKNYQNPVLWSHYASKHRGVCLGFDTAEGLKEVRYTKDRLAIRFREGDPEKGLEEDFVVELLLTKYLHWSYEEEVRIWVKLDESTKESGSYFYPFDEKLVLRQVILGPLCELPVDRIRQFVHSAYADQASVVRARLAYNSFSVVYDEESIAEENAYFENKGLPAQYKIHKS